MAKNKQLWYGFLEAGPKSTAVLIDANLSTGNPDTLYMFNLARDRILEYSRALVEPKLRELDEGDTSLIDQLEAGFAGARDAFQPRVQAVTAVAETTRTVLTDPTPVEESLSEDVEADDEELDELIGAGGEDVMEDEDEDWDEDED
jgi:hypothetical protein